MTYHHRSGLPTDLSTLAALCRLSFLPDAGMFQNCDGNPRGLSRLAGRHRVQGLAWSALKTSNADLEKHIDLKRQAEQILADNLVAMDTSGILHDRFNRAGLPHLFFKGLTLSQLAYGDPFVKMNADVDLLIDPREIDDAAAILTEIGYQCAYPSSSSLKDWHKVRKESVWVTRGKPTLELHTRLAGTVHPAACIRADGRRQWVTLQSGPSLPTLHQDDLLPYLAVHGGSCAWFRLKWLADFAALMARADTSTVTKPSDRNSVLAVNLCARVFGVGRPEAKGDPIDRLLERISIAQLSNPREPTDRTLGTLTMHIGQLLVGGAPMRILASLREKILEIAMKN